jgi:hypothetical protein
MHLARQQASPQFWTDAITQISPFSFKNTKQHLLRTAQEASKDALSSPIMITKFMTDITAKFNPFSACAKPARLFLTFLPPNARANGTNINTSLLPRMSTEPSLLSVKFSAFLSLSLSSPGIDGATVQRFNC